MDERIFPPIAADERTMLLAFLDFYRNNLAIKTDGLTDDEARRASVPPSDLSLMGLIRHMADVERSWFRRAFLGEVVGPIFYGEAHPDGDRDGDFHPTASDTLDDALATWHSEIEIARGIVDQAHLDDRAVRIDPHLHEPPSLRWIVVHMIEEYARHCGHADLLREAIDGVTGD